jgi:EF hand
MGTFLIIRFRAMPIHRVRGTCFLAAVSLCLAAGCAEVKLPSYSPGAAASAAMAEYDTNKDGFLGAAELERCPALKTALKRFDTDGDGKISEKEISARLAAYKDAGVGRVAVSCQVLLDGTPLPDATVHFVPEKFMGDNYKTGTGTTDTDGFAEIQIDGDSLPGLPSGLYRVEISKLSAPGQELVPARFNTRTTLGQEVAADALSGRAGNPVFRLTSR